MNGCGPKWLPQWIKDNLLNCYFRVECDEHDRQYKVGGTEHSRLVYDKIFFFEMCEVANKFTGVGNYSRLAVALFFYWAVRLLGWTRFNYGK